MKLVLWWSISAFLSFSLSHLSFCIVRGASGKMGRRWVDFQTVYSKCLLPVHFAISGVEYHHEVLEWFDTRVVKGRMRMVQSPVNVCEVVSPWKHTNTSHKLHRRKCGLQDVSLDGSSASVWQCASAEDRKVTPILVSYRKEAGARSDFDSWGCDFTIFRTPWVGRMFS